MKTNELIIHICASLTFLYAILMPMGEIETIFQEITWILLRVFWILVSISFEISLINIREVK